MKFRKRPVVIDAYLYSGKPEEPGWPSGWLNTVFWIGINNKLELLTLEGLMQASPGDWVIKGIAGEFYPCKPDIFMETYMPVLPIDPDYFESRLPPNLSDMLEAANEEDDDS